ncbi:MAG: bifunctional isocitrate dehydrogenase kinase/phosphatase [Gammaproteobacteria bacterium]|nr:MAG: bifunctional isocitrate dehydrogenase kinase/phosphatase [Gammaproteobacteria bacterium]
MDQSSDLALAHECAGAIRDGFFDYNSDFREITRRARGRFERRDWINGRKDAVERIELYDHWVNRLVDWLNDRLDDRCHDRALWLQIKSDFSSLIEDYLDQEFTKTYFSSITRRMFHTVGVDADLEFVDLEDRPIEHISQSPPLDVFPIGDPPSDGVRDLLQHFAFGIGWENLEYSVRFLVGQLRVHWRSLGGLEALGRIECLQTVFYQNTRAYVVGRAVGKDGRNEPLVIALMSTAEGVAVDAVLTSRSDVSILFGFTRSYIHADLETVADVVVLLRSILPGKPIAEIFTVLGRAKQGKTERYRSFARHLTHSSDKFITAPGDKGMVMAVFTLPSYDIVFKIIRDRFAYPKTVVRRDVLDKYQLVFKRDRAGRLVDAQEFRLLKFKTVRFEKSLLEELLAETSDTVRIEGDNLVIEHLYIERRLTPLNLYLRDAPPEDARMAVIDYGQAIRDLALTNIFPGDLLLKNFGVTRNGRVIFYDYDELCLVTDCNFRDLPKASTLEEEMEAEAWFYVGDDDVFPEQFISFLGLEPDHMEVLLESHGDLLTADFWRQMKKRHKADEVLEVLPYRRSLMAPPPPGSRRRLEGHD